MSIHKNQRLVKRLKVSLPPVIDRNQLDRFVIDTVLKTLYNNADIDTLHLESQIYKPNGIRMSRKESERLWSVMVSSGWINPVIGFGNSGKISLSRDGYQLMAQYGGYSEYLAAIHAVNQPTIILPFPSDESKSAAPVDKKNDAAGPKPDNK